MDTGLLVGIIGVGGTLLGTLLGSLLEFWRERTRRSHEQKVRYNQERIQIYSEFLSALHTTRVEVNDFFIQNPKAKSAGSRDPIFPEPLAKIFREVAFAQSKVEIISSPTVRKRGNELHFAIGKYFYQTDSDDLQKKIDREYFTARTNFIDAVRNELDLDDNKLAAMSSKPDK